eukprot:6185617-Pleurochrysis_carterae.AAC.1
MRRGLVAVAPGGAEATGVVVSLQRPSESDVVCGACERACAVRANGRVGVSTKPCAEACAYHRALAAGVLSWSGTVSERARRARVARLSPVNQGEAPRTHGIAPARASSCNAHPSRA